MSSKIVHILSVEKFIPAFIETVELNFNIDNHKMVFLSKKKLDYGLKDNLNYIWIDKKIQFFKLSSLLYKSDKIILHSLFFGRFLMIVLFFQPWLIKKCYWLMWGGDFYFPERKGWVKKQIIKRIRHFVTFLKGDFELLKKWYGAKGMLHECFMYPSNIYKEYDVQPKEDEGIINIQVGNSADPTNNHIKIFEKLSKHKNENIKIYTPLSYGDQAYVKAVVSKGKEIFGDKFIALIDFMPFEKYLDFLGAIDIAIFAHKRQQAMGNIITLLGLGKKVYIRSDITTWQFFKDINVRLSDFNNFELAKIDSLNKKINKDKIKSFFSEDIYLKQLQSFLN